MIQKRSMLIITIFLFIGFALGSDLLVNAQELPVNTATLAWHPDGTMLAVKHRTTVDIVDQNQQVLNSLNAVQAVGVFVDPVWSPDGNKLAIVNNPTVEIWQSPWDSNTAQLVATFSDPNISIIRSVTWKPDGTEVAIAHGENFSLFNVNAGTSTPRIRIDGLSVILDLEWTENDRLTIASSNSIVANVNPYTQEVVNYYYDSAFEVYQFETISFSPDHSELAIGRFDGLIDIWDDTKTTEFLTEMSRIAFSLEAIINSVDWNPNGEFIAASGEGGIIRIWDSETGDLLETLNLGANVNVASIDWSPDGTQLAYGGEQGEVVILDCDFDAPVPCQPASEPLIID